MCSVCVLSQGIVPETNPCDWLVSLRMPRSLMRSINLNNSIHMTLAPEFSPAKKKKLNNNKKKKIGWRRMSLTTESNLLPLILKNTKLLYR